jgi:AcrR family transcriptional regulator
VRKGASTFPEQLNGFSQLSDRSHAAIMDAVYTLLQEKSVRDLTIEEVAKRARVGKPTLYKWWPTKATLVLAMLCERMAPSLEAWWPRTELKRR